MTASDLIRPTTYLITSGQLNKDNFAQQGRRLLATIRLAVELGVSMVQVREKQLSGRLLCEFIATAADITRDSATKLLVNDRADIAAASGADGVHLTARSMPAAVIRNCFPDLMIGVSTHSLEDVREAATANADFVVFGPVFDTAGKSGVGSDALAAVCKEVPNIRVLAIGGIDQSNLDQVLSAGAAGFAAIRAMNDAGKLRAIMAQINADH